MTRLLFMLALCLPLPTYADTGVNLFSIEAPHHGRSMDVAYLYPSKGGTPRPFGENAVFHGVTVHDYATLAPGKHPVILMSHGWGGNFMRMGWLSSVLVEKGAIVVAVNHPNSTTGDTQNSSALNHWTRAQDLSLALDHLLEDPQFAEHIDAARIYAVGFSYGGWTALSLGGLRGRAEGYALYCQQAGEGSTHCRDLSRAGIDISKLDAAKWNASWKDPRIRAVVAIDPALTWGVGERDTKDLDVPVLMIGLGEGKYRLSATDTSSAGSHFESLLPTAAVERIVPASHFSALGLCKPEGAAILEEEKDDPVCTDPVGSDRKAVAAQIITLTAKHFKIE